LLECERNIATTYVICFSTFTLFPRAAVYVWTLSSL
jgi:hypothetical protein